METVRWRVAILVALYVVFLCGATVGECRDKQPDNTPPFLVASSILPWGEFLQEMCGERCTVRVLIPPGATPHTWSPSPSVLKDMVKARLFVYTGECLEPWVKDFIGAVIGGKAGGQKRDIEKWTLNVSRLSPNGCAKDPHLWLDFEFDQRVVLALSKRLSQIDPVGSLYYEERGMQLVARLKALDDSFRKRLSGCRQKTVIIAGHNAFRRLATAYGLSTLSVMGISPDAHITPRSLSRVIKFIREKGARAIFFDHAVTDRIAKIISQETGAKVLGLYIGVSMRAEDLMKGMGFFDMMEYDLNSLAEGLGCHAQ